MKQLFIYPLLLCLVIACHQSVVTDNTTVDSSNCTAIQPVFNKVVTDNTTVDSSNIRIMEIMKIKGIPIEHTASMPANCFHVNKTLYLRSVEPLINEYNFAYNITVDDSKSTCTVTLNGQGPDTKPSLLLSRLKN